MKIVPIHLKEFRGRFLFWFLIFFLAGSLFVANPSTALSQEVDILWQGSGYAPPFYKGRTLWGNQTGLILYAVPHVSGHANRQALNYKWTRNGTVAGAYSGPGKNSFYVADSILGNTQAIRLEVLAPNGAILVTRYFDMSPIKPKIFVYENNPLYGVLFHREVGEAYTMREREITFSAFPMFFTRNSRTSGIVNFSWRTNQGELSTRNSSTYRAPEGASGSSRVTVKAENPDRIIQSSSKSFLVRFGE
jgi:hypothetical protein